MEKSYGEMRKDNRKEGRFSRSLLKDEVDPSTVTCLENFLLPFKKKKKYLPFRKDREEGASIPFAEEASRGSENFWRLHPVTLWAVRRSELGPWSALCLQKLGDDSE